MMNASPPHPDLPRVPLVDLAAQYRTLASDIDAAIKAVIADTAFVRGPFVEAFEERFAAYCETAACAGVGNGTDALALALRVLGIGPGDEVITVANTFIATAEAVSLNGAVPVFVDVDPATLLIDPARLDAALTPRTRAIVPVHLFGQPCDMDAVMAFAGRHDLKVVEDAAQAHGARWKGKRVGTFGDLGCFSFYPGKNLGAYGDGGAVVGADAALVAEVRRLGDHGGKGTHATEGTNSRLDGLQAAILSAKLPHLDAWNDARRRLADRYRETVPLPPDAFVAVHEHAEPVWHLFVARVDDRDGLRAVLDEHGVASGVHYPTPLHRQPAYARLGLGPGTLPVTEDAAARIVSLPLFPELTAHQQDRVVAAVAAWRERADVASGRRGR